MLVQSQDMAIGQLTVRWVFDDFMKYHRLPVVIHDAVYQLIRPFRHVWLAFPLQDWLATPDAPYRQDVIQWLSELPYPSGKERLPVIETLCQQFFTHKADEPALTEALKVLDTPDGDVTNAILQRFPAKTMEENSRIILFLGQIGKLRIVKPLITFAQEYPEYLRVVMKALSKLDYDDVDQFYLWCLGEANHQENPLILIEAIKQVRKRRLRKGIAILDQLFPMEKSPSSLVNRAVNGEIALTMASFGVYAWAREKLLSEMMLNGINQKYLKAVEMLNLEEAVPVLKAIILMPETAEIMALQHEAYRICEGLLLQRSHRSH